MYLICDVCQEPIQLELNSGWIVDRWFEEADNGLYQDGIPVNVSYIRQVRGQRYYHPGTDYTIHQCLVMPENWRVVNI